MDGQGGAAERARRLLVLDFDGVICDSVEECFLASWTAYHAHLLGDEAARPPESARGAFRKLRPFVRSGEDFILIQHLVRSRLVPESQEEFDDAWNRPGLADRRTCKDLFYRARTDLHDGDPRAWLAMNRIYPHVAEALGRLSQQVPLFVLSTKKPRFVIAPLEAAHLPVAAERVLYAEAEPKLATIEGLLQRWDVPEAVFVEDQVDAIRGNTNPRIRTFLATWGYVQQEWLRKPAGFTLLAPEGFGELLSSL
jgi:phosphoglycolate phosphatase-like HAD superfamily hydrolase